MRKFIPLVLTYSLLCIVSDITATWQEKQCFSQVSDAQNRLNILVKQLEEVCHTAKLPQKNIEKIKIIKDLIRKLRKLSKKDLRALDEVILSNLERHRNGNLRLDKIEKRIHEYKVKARRNNETIKQLEDILMLIKKSDTHLHNNTYVRCEKAQNYFKTFEKDVNYINETYKNLDKAFGDLILRDANLRSQHDDDISEIESLIDDIKIPQSYVSKYLCYEENKLQKTIDENLDALDSNKDLLNGIVEGLNKKDATKVREIKKLTNFVTSLNTDLEVVHDILKEYEEQILDEASIESISKKDLDELEKDAYGLDHDVSEIISKIDTSIVDDFLDEYERKLGVLKFILSEENIEAVHREADRFDNYNKRLQKLIKDRSLLEVQLEDIKQLVEQMMLQSVCQRTGSEDTSH